MGIRKTVGLLVAIVMIAAVAPVRGSELPAIDAPALNDRVLVKFRRTATREQRADALAAIGGRIELPIPGIGWDVVRLGASLGARGALARLGSHPAVADAEPNYTGAVALTPNDRCYLGCLNGARQWNIDAVNALAGWDVVPGRFYTADEKRSVSQLLVAVLDTKIDVNLADWANPSPTPKDRPSDVSDGGQLALDLAEDFVPEAQLHGTASYHGSFVAGILGAAAHNGTDIAGLGYRATIVPVTVVDGNGATNAGWLAAGIDYAASLGVKVINLSLGIGGSSSAVQDAIFRANSAGALVVAAAGNNASNQPFYPAWHDEVMAVTAVDVADRPGVCSNYSSHTSVAAPGVGIVSLDPSRAEKISVAPCGTSTAAPHVSALAALLFAQSPARTPAQVRALIERNSDDDRFFPGVDERFGYGRVNFERALRDGNGPVVNRVLASIPRNIGGTSTVTAVATAVSPTIVTAAEYFLDRPGAPGAGSPLSAADGAFGERSEQLTAEIQVPLTFETGVHRLYVRAYDGTRWGAASVGVLLVDRTPPEIREFTITPTAIGVAGQGVRISFRAVDDLSSSATYTYQVSRTVLGVTQVVYESEPKTITLPALEAVTWRPAPADRGPYDVKLTLRDEGQNPAFAQMATLVL